MDQTTRENPETLNKIPSVQSEPSQSVLSTKENTSTSNENRKEVYFKEKRPRRVLQCTLLPHATSRRKLALPRLTPYVQNLVYSPPPHYALGQEVNGFLVAPSRLLLSRALQYRVVVRVRILWYIHMSFWMYASFSQRCFHQQMTDTKQGRHLQEEVTHMHPPPKPPTLCPVPECGCMVKKLCNHLFAFHKDTGKHTGKSKFAIVYTYVSMDTCCIFSSSVAQLKEFHNHVKEQDKGRRRRQRGPQLFQ